MRPGIDLSEKRVLVVGMARSGVASALFCAARGARVTATDAEPESKLADAAAKRLSLRFDDQLVSRDVFV